MKRKLLVISCLSIFVLSAFAQNKNFKFDKTHSFGLGYGLVRGHNGTFAIDYTGSSNYFAWSIDGLAISPENEIDNNYLYSQLGLKIGFLAQTKEKSYISILCGMSRVYGFHKSTRMKIGRYGIPSYHRHSEEFTKLGIPIETNLVFSIFKGIGFGFRGFVNVNSQVNYYGFIGSIRITMFK